MQPCQMDCTICHGGGGVDGESWEGKRNGTNVYYISPWQRKARQQQIIYKEIIYNITILYIVIQYNTLIYNTIIIYKEMFWEEAWTKWENILSYFIHSKFSHFNQLHESNNIGRFSRLVPCFHNLKKEWGNLWGGPCHKQNSMLCTHYFV